jgi:MarR family transcriptional regulator, 2-MHQ and catechol-resistance regulon repressor
MQPIRSLASAEVSGSDPREATTVAFDDALWRLIRVIQFRDRDRICCAGLTVSQGHALQLIAQTPGMRLVDLAARLHLDKSTATRVVAALVELGYVRRSADPADGRAVVLSFTARGRRAHADLRALLAREHEEVLTELSTRDRAQVTGVLMRISDMLERREGVPSGSQGPGCGPEKLP